MRYVLSWLIFWLSVVCAIHTTSTGAAPTGKQSSYQVGANRNLCSIFPSSGRDYLERAWKGSVSNLCVPPSKFIFRCLNLNMFLSCFYSRRSTADSRQHEEPNNAPYTIIQSAGDSFTKTRMVFSMLSEIASESEDLDQANFIEIRAIDSGGVRLPTKFHHDDVVSLIKQLYVEKQHLHRGTLEHVLNLVKPILAEEPNIVKIPPMQRVTVVGDLHGSLADLSRIFELAGWPGPGNTFVFNGDFVDRGDRGIEIIAVLFALKVIHPKNIILNRGNHEDTKICKLYGFFDEVLCKYGSRALYEMVCDVFTQLPLGCIIGNEAFVVHAGVPRQDERHHRPDQLHSEEEAQDHCKVRHGLWSILPPPIPLFHLSSARAACSSLPILPILPTGSLVPRVSCRHEQRGMGGVTPARLPPVGADAQVADDRRGEVRHRAKGALTCWQDLLWSDPVDPTIDQTAKDFEATPNYFRGAGIRYGPGVVREFLKKNKLKTLVRSHQCVGKGWEEIHCGVLIVKIPRGLNNLRCSVGMGKEFRGRYDQLYPENRFMTNRVQGRHILGCTFCDPLPGLQEQVRTKRELTASLILDIADKNLWT
eukprot:762928-Hanusia_phi.AAC.3